MRLLERIPVRNMIWLFLVVFIIHDGEEVLTVQQWANDHSARLKGLFPSLGFLLDTGFYSTFRFGVTVAILLVGAVVVCWYAARSLSPGIDLTIFAVVVLVLFVNGLTHVEESLLLGTYTPGVVTAVLFSLPYSILAFLRLRQAGLLTGWLRRTGTLWAMLASVPILVLVHLVSRAVLE